jgi:hypothetical protein
MLTKRRPSYNRKSALIFLPIYEELLRQVKSGKPQGIFLATHHYNNVAPSTLQNRFTDALKWLRDCNMDEALDRRKDFEYLRACITTRLEPTGIRIIVMSGPLPETTLRPNNLADLTQASDWKTEVEKFLTGGYNPGESAKQWHGILVSGDNILWLKKVTSSLGAAYFLEGDTLTVAREK